MNFSTPAGGVVGSSPSLSTNCTGFRPAYAYKLTPPVLTGSVDNHLASHGARYLDKWYVIPLSSSRSMPVNRYRFLAKLPKVVSPYGVNSSRLTIAPIQSTTTLLLPR